jgi:polyhydroxyalkanoate synthesis regulator phasin
MASRKADRDKGLPETLRDAVERTFAATAESATGTRTRVQDLVDEVARRGQEASSDLAHRVSDAAQDLRFVRGEDLRDVTKRLAAIERRLAALEKAGAPKRPARKAATTKKRTQTARKK